MNITALPIFVADIIVRPTPPPILKNVEGGGLASLALWAMAVVAALILWRMRRRRALIANRSTSISTSAVASSPEPGPTPAGPK